MDETNGLDMMLSTNGEKEDEDPEESSMALAPSLLNLFDAVISREAEEPSSVLLDGLNHNNHIDGDISDFTTSGEDHLTKDVTNYEERRLENDEEEVDHQKSCDVSMEEPLENSPRNSGGTRDNYDVGTSPFMEGNERLHHGQCNGDSEDNPDGRTCKEVIARTQKNVTESDRAEGQPNGKKVRPASAEILMEDDNFVLVEDPATVEDAASQCLQYRKSSRINPPSIRLSVKSPPRSPPPSPPSTPKIVQHGGTHLDHIVREVVVTEYKYVRDLGEIIMAYMDPLRRSGYSPLTDEKFNILFCNLEDIYAFNRDFLSDLEQCNNNPVYVAECFLECEESFSVYTTYCTNYPKAIKLLTECANNDVVSQYFREVQSEIGHGLPLGAYLLKPVQRILKYHLLFQKMCKHFSPDSEGYEVIIDALESMVDIASHINEMKRKHEAAIHVQEIQSQLHGMEGLQENITSYGDLVLEDTFRMRRAERYLYLFEKALLICKKDDAVLIFKACVKCSDLMLIENVPKEPLAFSVVLFDQQNFQYTITAKSAEQKTRWTHEIKRLIIENYTRNIPDNVKARILKAITPEDHTDKGSLTHSSSTDGGLGRNRKIRKSGRRGRRNSEPIAKQLQRGQKQVKAAVESFITGMKRPDLSKTGHAGSDGTALSADELLDNNGGDEHTGQAESPEKSEERVPGTTTVYEDVGGNKHVRSATTPVFGLSPDSKRDSGIGSMTITEVQKSEVDDKEDTSPVSRQRNESNRDEDKSPDEVSSATPGQTAGAEDKGMESPDELEVLENLSGVVVEQPSEKPKGNLEDAFKLRRADMKHYQRILKRSDAIWERMEEPQFRERSSSNSLPRSAQPPPRNSRPHLLLTRTVSEGVCAGGLGPRTRKLSYSDSNIAVKPPSSDDEESSKDSSSSSLTGTGEQGSPLETQGVQPDSDSSDNTTTGVLSGGDTAATNSQMSDQKDNQAVQNGDSKDEVGDDRDAEDVQVVEVPVTATPHRVFSLARKFSVMAKEHQRPTSFKNIRHMKEEMGRRNRQRTSTAESGNLEANYQPEDTSIAGRDSGNRRMNYRLQTKPRRSSKSDPFAERDGTRSIVTVSANKDGTTSVMTNPEGSKRLNRSNLWRQRRQEAGTDFTDAADSKFQGVSDDEDDSAFLARSGKWRSNKQSIGIVETGEGSLMDLAGAMPHQVPSLRKKLESLQEQSEPVKTREVDPTKFKSLRERLQELEQSRDRPIERRRVLHTTSFSSADSVSSWGDDGSQASSRRSSANSSILGRLSQSFDSSRSSLSTQEADGGRVLEFKSLRERFEELERAISKPVPRFVDPVKDLKVYKERSISNSSNSMST